MRTIERMIEQEVLVCLSSLVSTLAEGYGAAIDTGPHGTLQAAIEQAFELASPVLDYEEAAREAGWLRHLDGEDYLCFVRNGENHYAADWDDLCRDNDIEPHEREVFEHWAVTDWFAEKLEAAGEKVDHDFAGMAIWARTTTGQAIYADAVIERIHADFAKLVEG